jgi:hypothetical protein
VNQVESFFALELKDVSRANGVGLPDLLIEFFTIDPAKFGTEIQYDVRVPPGFKDLSEGLSQLTKIRYIATDFIWDVRMLCVKTKYPMASGFQNSP